MEIYQFFGIVKRSFRSSRILQRINEILPYETFRKSNSLTANRISKILILINHQSVFQLPVVRLPCGTLLDSASSAVPMRFSLFQQPREAVFPVLAYFAHSGAWFQIRNARLSLHSSIITTTSTNNNKYEKFLAVVMWYEKWRHWPEFFFFGLPLHLLHFHRIRFSSPHEQIVVANAQVQNLIKWYHFFLWGHNFKEC